MPPEEFVQRVQEAGQLGAVFADVRRGKALAPSLARRRSPTPPATPVDPSDAARHPTGDGTDGDDRRRTSTADGPSSADATADDGRRRGRRTPPMPTTPAERAVSADRHRLSDRAHAERYAQSEQRRLNGRRPAPSA